MAFDLSESYPNSASAMRLRRQDAGPLAIDSEECRSRSRYQDAPQFFTKALSPRRVSFNSLASLGFGDGAAEIEAPAVFVPATARSAPRFDRVRNVIAPCDRKHLLRGAVPRLRTARLSAVPRDQALTARLRFPSAFPPPVPGKADPSAR